MELQITLEGEKFEVVVDFELDEDRNTPYIDYYELNSKHVQDDVYFHSFSYRALEAAIWDAYGEAVKESKQP